MEKPQKKKKEFLSGAGVKALLSEKRSDVSFFVLILFYSFYRGCPMVISKKTIIFHCFRGGGNVCQEGPTISRGGGGGGVQMLISIKTHITCYFPRGSGPPIPLLDPHMQLEIHSHENTNKITDVPGLTCTTFHFIFSFCCFFI